MFQFAQFETSTNAKWFCGNLSAFWHKHVFGSKETPNQPFIRGAKQRRRLISVARRARTRG
jgi:hypothetical protein